MGTEADLIRDAAGTLGRGAGGSPTNGSAQANPSYPWSGHFGLSKSVLSHADGSSRLASQSGKAAHLLAPEIGQCGEVNWPD